jgi:hypothetical protein
LQAVNAPKLGALGEGTENARKENHFKKESSPFAPFLLCPAPLRWSFDFSSSSR